MKGKITDLMDLYEGPGVSFDPAPAEASHGKETVEVKQEKRQFGWREALSLAAALGVVVLGILGVKLLAARSAVQTAASGSSPVATMAQPTETAVRTDTEAPAQTEPSLHLEADGFSGNLILWESDTALGHEVSRFLTPLAEQGILALNKLRGDEYALASFAHLYAKLHEPEALVYREGDDGTYETLTLDWVKGLLDRYFGLSFTPPAEGTDYTLLRGDNYAQHESFRDGCFWFPAADGDQHACVALCWSLGTLQEVASAVKETDDRFFAGFTVYEVNLEAWPDYDREALADLSVGKAQELAAQGKLTATHTGSATLRQAPDGLRLLEYRVWDIEPTRYGANDLVVEADGEEFHMIFGQTEPTPQP